MNTQISPSASLNILKIALQVNVHASIIILLIVSILTISGSDLLFTELSELYGPLAGNLRLMLVYLCIVEITVFSYCHFSNNYQGTALLGIFLLLLIPALAFYGRVNQIPIDNNYHWLFLYLGVSHLLYGLFAFMIHSQK